MGKGTFLLLLFILVALLYTLADDIIKFSNAALIEGKETRVLHVYDGDTLTIPAPYLPDNLPKKISVRVFGVDTPEKGHRANCKKERRLAAKARIFVTNKVKNSNSIKVAILKWDKYGGRVLGEVYFDGEPLSKMLIDEGLAVPYNGRGAKKDWCKL